MQVNWATCSSDSCYCWKDLINLPYLNTRYSSVRLDAHCTRLHSCSDSVVQQLRLRAAETRAWAQYKVLVRPEVQRRQGSPFCPRREARGQAQHLGALSQPWQMQGIEATQSISRAIELASWSPGWLIGRHHRVTLTWLGLLGRPTGRQSSPVWSTCRRKQARPATYQANAQKSSNLPLI